MCRINTAIMIEVAIIIILRIMRFKISFQVFSTNGKIDTLILSMILNGSFCFSDIVRLLKENCEDGNKERLLYTTFDLTIFRFLIAYNKKISTIVG